MAIRLAARRVLRPDGSLRPAALVLDGGRIAAVEDLDPSQAEGCPDRTLCPGLIDIQVNGLGDVDVATGDADALARLGMTLRQAGTTAWCPTLTSQSLEWYSDWFAAHARLAPGEIGIHLEGPFLTRAGAHRRTLLRAPDAGWLDALPTRVAIVTLAPELPGALEAISSLRSRGVVVALGHSEATYTDALTAAGRGATLVTHVFNAMPALQAREPGLVGAALTDERLVPAVIADGVHLHPCVLGLVLSSGPAVLTTDSVAWESRGLSVVGGAARLGDGTLAGSVITMAQALRAAVAAGVGLGVALTAATTTPAHVLGLSSRGTLVPGARADVVALDPDLAVTGVWVEGRPIER